MKSGTPTSSVLKLGSGEMTDLAAKFTLFPIIFILKRPYFFSRICRTPLMSLSAILVARLESMKQFTESCS